MFGSARHVPASLWCGKLRAKKQVRKVTTNSVFSCLEGVSSVGLKCEVKSINRQESGLKCFDLYDCV